MTDPSLIYDANAAALNDPDCCWIVGRNGSFGITRTEITQRGGLTYIEGVGKRKHPINGGLRIETKSMDRLALYWLLHRAMLPTVDWQALQDLTNEAISMAHAAPWFYDAEQNEYRCACCDATVTAHKAFTMQPGPETNLLDLPVNHNPDCPWAKLARAVEAAKLFEP